jgi:hypothetical protein
MAYIGTKPANQVIDSTLIADGTVTTADIADSAITTAKIAAGAVVEADIADSAVTNSKIASLAATKLTGTIAAARLPAGSVLQVVSTTTNSSFSTSATSFVNITGMSLSITPSSTTSKILVMGHMQVGGGDDARYSAYRLTRNSTNVIEGNKGGNNGTVAFLSSGGANGGNRPYTNENMGFNYLDSPASTSALTYTIQVNPNVAFSGRVFYLNRPEDLADALRIWTVSTLTLIEIAG